MVVYILHIYRFGSMFILTFLFHDQSEAKTRERFAETRNARMKLSKYRRESSALVVWSRYPAPKVERIPAGIGNTG